MFQTLKFFIWLMQVFPLLNIEKKNVFCLKDGGIDLEV